MGLGLAHQVFGDGPPLVILHGLFGSGRNWASLSRRLGEAWRVYTLDLRNHGASPWSDVMTYPAMAEDLRDFFDAQGIERAQVVGHSMGGKAAMALALAQSARVRALVVVDIAPVAYGHGFADYIAAMRSLDLTRLTRRSEADAALREAIPEPGVRSFILQNLESRDGRLAWRLNLASLADHMGHLTGFPEELEGRSYAGPSLFVGGGLSDYIGPQYHTDITAFFPSAEIAKIPGAGHWVHAEQPEAFMERVVPFLRGQGGEQL